jgi:hypothetical protein
LTKEVIASLTGWEFILAAISVAGLWGIGIRSFLTDGYSQIYTAIQYGSLKARQCLKQ